MTQHVQTHPDSETQRTATTRKDGKAYDYGTSYLQDDTGHRSWESWRKIQTEFVDNPQQAVSEAHQLVSDLMDSIVSNFRHKRDELEHRWSSSEDVSTEDLRQCLQNYRDFFGRLLPTADVEHQGSTARRERRV